MHQTATKIAPVKNFEEQQQKKESNSDTGMMRLGSGGGAAYTNTDSPTNAKTRDNKELGDCCAGCGKPIRDRFIFSVIDLHWHQNCVQCVDCSLNLKEKCYTFDGKLYCKLDYFRRFEPKCFACRESIGRNDLVQKIKGNRVYHLKCFTCNDCHKQLKTGEQMHLIDGKRLLCNRDYHNHHNHHHHLNQSHHHLQANNNNNKPPSATNNNLNSTNNNNNEQHLTSAELSGLLAGDEVDDLDDQNSTIDGETSLLGDTGLSDETGLTGDCGPESMRFAGHYVPDGQAKSTEELLKGHDCGDDLVDANGKRRGPRTTIKPKQLETLRQAFDNTPKPSRHVREQLAAQTGLNMRVIQVWFQNRRSKERRMKNSNGSARRNFFRSSSRRLRVGPNSAAAAAAAAAVQGSNGTSATNPTAGNQQQQSLIAGNRTGGNKQQKQQQQQLSPLDQTTDQMGLNVANQMQAGRQHNSPSEFGGSSSGGFTYFSDSSNQGDAFAINTSAVNHQQSQQSQQTQSSSQAPTEHQQQQQQQYLSNVPPDQGSLIALESPPSGGPNGQQQQQQAKTQQQYGGGQMNKSTGQPPQPQSIYPGGEGAQQQQPHMMMMMMGHPPPPPPGSVGPPPQNQQPQQLGGHQHQHSLLSGQMMQQNGGPGINGLLAHPQGPSVVQW